jgi:dephospho-CoA kinase
VTDSGPRWLLGGGIGCGKSTVRTSLTDAGIMTIDADELGHGVLAPGGAAFEAVASQWPNVVFDGVIERGMLGEIVFSDPGQLATLESLTHPHIIGTIISLVEGNEGPVVVEVPVLRMVPPGRWRRIVVDCLDETRLERVVARGMSRPSAMARMASQPSRSEWLACADVVAPNHGGLQELKGTVDKLLDVIQLGA